MQAIPNVRVILVLHSLLLLLEISCFVPSLASITLYQENDTRMVEGRRGREGEGEETSLHPPFLPFLPSHHLLSFLLLPTFHHLLLRFHPVCHFLVFALFLERFALRSLRSLPHSPSYRTPPLPTISSFSSMMNAQCALNALSVPSFTQAYFGCGRTTVWPLFVFVYSKNTIPTRRSVSLSLHFLPSPSSLHLSAVDSFRSERNAQ